MPLLQQRKDNTDTPAATQQLGSLITLRTRSAQFRPSRVALFGRIQLPKLARLETGSCIGSVSYAEPLRCQCTDLDSPAPVDPRHSTTNTRRDGNILVSFCLSVLSVPYHSEYFGLRVTTAHVSYLYHSRHRYQKIAALLGAIKLPSFRDSTGFHF